MCGGGGAPKAPDPVDPAAESAKLAQEATASANAKVIATARRKRSASNLLADLGDGLDTLGGVGTGQAAGTVLGGAVQAGLAGAAQGAGNSLLSSAMATPGRTGSSRASTATY